MDKMIPKGVLAVLFLIVSGIFAYLIIPDKFQFPYLGFALLFATITVLGFTGKKKRTGFEIVLFGVLLALCAFLQLRANIVLSLLTILTIVFLGSYFLLLPKGIANLLSVLFLPVKAIVSVLQSKNEYSYKQLHMPSKSPIGRIGEHIPAILITVVVLLIVIPLLSYANPFFQKLVGDFLKALDLTWLLKYISEHAVLNMFRIILFLFLAVLLPRIPTIQTSSKTERESGSFSILKINMLVPKLALSLILIIFFVTQLQLYFSSADTLQSLGYTNSQYAREVFAQLSIVALIIFLLIYSDRSSNKISRYLTVLLVVQGAFLSAIALKSVYDYTTQYGFTHKRLYGYAGVAWIFGLLALFAYHFYRREFQERFVKHTVGYSALIVLSINVLNFDYLIYHHAKPTVFGVDHEYLSRLSPDARSYDVHLPILLDLVRTETNHEKKAAYVNATYQLLSRIQYLQMKYEKLPPGGFNLSEYRMYQKIKHVPVEEQYKFLTVNQPEFNPSPVQNPPPETDVIVNPQ